ncbi:uncharacterized protein C1orf158 homolog [Dendronephthya gigantea]|uniref:uncharacterized protein C1orf158 homolog n=1 Tax=Dendronephthya gigantea TaxID=151771 RepID=UPI00106CEA0F|nr:uncharacterized protein C1orf158 homolog [Dendronephthya gigantea]
MKQKKITNKWDLPGWKFEPGYSPRTLVGDWFEERKIFSKGQMSCVTSNMMEFKAYDSDFKLRDWRSMWNNRIGQQSGFGLKYLLDHHNNDYVTRRLSTYNLEFSSPFRMETTKYQPRRWNGFTQRWEPEKMELPISKNKTLYDTIQKMKTNLRDLTTEEKGKKEKAFVFPAPQDLSTKAPKFSYRHHNKQRP